MSKTKNPWAKINETPPKYQIGDIVYTYLTFRDEFVNVLAMRLPRQAFVQLAKAVVVGYEMGEATYESPSKWLPLYVVKILKIYFNVIQSLEVGEEITINRWWVEQGDDAYTKVFGKRPKHVEFVFR